jgi:UDP:flavonoid glycosyltransferase YjiC (YdhE family)
MKIGMQTWGSDGDIRPFVALAGGLRKAGHDVTLGIASVDGKDYSALATALDFRVVHYHPGPGPDIMETAHVIKGTRNPVIQIQTLADAHLAPYQDEMLDSALEMGKDCDIFIGHHILGGLKAAAEKSGIGYCAVFLCHMAFPSRHWAPHPFPNLGGFLNGALWKIGDAFLNIVLRPHYNRLRMRLDLPLLADVLYTGWKSQKLNLVGASPQLARRLPDWDDSIKICGFWEVPLSAEPWQPPPGLTEFMDGGEPPVYLTCGSMTQFEPDKTTRIMTEAVLLSGRRAIIQSHWDVVSYTPDSPNIFRISKTPHHKIFPRCALVVHHGGAGTTQSATYCGVPSVVVAFAFDQSFWGGELKKLGIGGKVFDARTITPQKLAGEINRIYSSKEAREKARLIGEAMRKENGVSRAVELIERAFAFSR